MEKVIKIRNIDWLNFKSLFLNELKKGLLIKTLLCQVSSEPGAQNFSFARLCLEKQLR